MAQSPLKRVVILILPALLLLFGLVSATTAQSNGTTVIVAGIESQDFPRVSAVLMVTGNNGPVSGLTTGDFQIFEGSSRTHITPVSVDDVSLEGLRLVLALDTSMSDADLAEAKAAASTLISSMTPKDRAAIITFGDETYLERGFTNNTTELQSVIDNLTPQGSQTALYQGLIDATTILEEFPEEPKAVIAITDSRDNAGSLSVDEAVSPAQEAGVSLYVVGLGNKVQSDHPLKDEVALTGGQYFTLSTTDEVQPAVEEIESLLRSGYKLTFLSKLMADNARHDLSIIVLHDNEQAQADSQFVATPGEVTVALPDITEEQIIAGVINLTPQVTAPTTFNSVTYLLDNQTLAEVTEHPYSFKWDTSSALPGAHTLSVKAVDDAGNEGRFETEIIVAVPVTIEIFTGQKEVQIGDLVAFQSKVKATAEIVSVDLLLDNELLDSQTTPPYKFDFDSSNYSPGSHVFTMRVEDALGQTARDSIILQFVPEPPPPPGWWERLTNDQRFWSAITIIIAETAIVSIGLVTIIVLLLIDSAHRKRSRRYSTLEIINTGNIQSQFLLQAKDTERDLKFQFSLGKTVLPQTPLLQTAPAVTGAMATGPAPVAPSYVTPQASAAYPQARSNVAVPTPAPASPPPPPSGGGDPRQAAARAKAAHGQARGCSQMLVQILSTLASILPGSAGSAVRGTAQQISAGQTAADAAVRAPTQMAQKTNRLSGQVSGAVPSGMQGQASTQTGRAGAVPAATPGTVSQPAAFQSGGGQVTYATTQTASSPSSQPQQAGYVGPTTVGPTAANGHQQKGDSGWSETPFIQPNEKLTIDLLIIPAKPFRKHTYEFTVTSRPFDLKGTSLVNEKALTQIKGVFWLWRYIPIFAVTLLMLTLILGVISLAIWQLTYINILDTSIMYELVWNQLNFKNLF